MPDVAAKEETFEFALLHLLKNPDGSLFIKIDPPGLIREHKETFERYYDGIPKGKVNEELGVIQFPKGKKASIQAGSLFLDIGDEFPGIQKSGTDNIPPGCFAPL